MSAVSASAYSLASTQECDDDVASVEWGGVSTAASYNTEDEEALLADGAAAALMTVRSTVTPPIGYGDDDNDVIEKPADDDKTKEEEEEVIEEARKDSTPARHIVDAELTGRVHDILREDKKMLKVEREARMDSDDEDEEEELEENKKCMGDRVDSEEEGVLTAIEIGAVAAAPAPLPPTPRRPDVGARSAAALARGQRPCCGPLPLTPRPNRMRVPLSGLTPPPPPFFPNRPFGAPGSFSPALFGPLGYGGPSMRPFNSMPPPSVVGGHQLTPHPSHHMGGGIGRHLGAPLPPPLPPRAYMGGGPPSSLGGGALGGGGVGGVAGFRPRPAGPIGHSHRSNPAAYAPPPAAGSAAAARREAATDTARSASPRSGRRISGSSMDRPFGRLPQPSVVPPTMASLGIGHAPAGVIAASAAAAAEELTPYPLVYVSPAGSISCVLNHDIVVEMSVDRSVRVVFHDHFSAFCNARGTSSAILHPTARILHTEDYVYTKFIANNEKMAVFGEQGVLFTMSHLSEAYLVNSSAYPGVSAVALDQLQFPSMDDDYTIKMFYTEAQTGQQFIALCKDIVSEATYDRRPDGSLYLHINGMLIRQSTAGDVIIDARPRQISCSPTKKCVHVRSGCIDMAVEEDERGYVKRAHKRVHVSRSGMVISDGNCITSMDHFGRIVCCN